MIPKLYSLKFLKEEYIGRNDGEITLDMIPKNCQVISIDLGRLEETKLILKIKYFTKEIESDEDYELRKEKLRKKYYQEYLNKLKELENDK